MVGIHLRRGDFVASAGDYDTTLSGPSPMLPIEWVEAAMRRCVEFWPGCVFFLSASQAEADCARLRRNFDLVQLPVENPYELSTPGHCADHASDRRFVCLGLLPNHHRNPDLQLFTFCRQCFGAGHDLHHSTLENATG